MTSGRGCLGCVSCCDELRVRASAKLENGLGRTRGAADALAISQWQHVLTQQPQYMPVANLTRLASSITRASNAFVLHSKWIEL